MKNASLFEHRSRNLFRTEGRSNKIIESDWRAAYVYKVIPVILYKGRNKDLSEMQS